MDYVIGFTSEKFFLVLLISCAPDFVLLPRRLMLRIFSFS